MWLTGLTQEYIERSLLVFMYVLGHFKRAEVLMTVKGGDSQHKWVIIADVTQAHNFVNDASQLRAVF